MLEQIPPHVRAALATVVMIGAAHLGYTVTEQTAAVVIVVGVWLVGAIIETVKTWDKEKGE
jgi:hypothetical protein